MGPQSTRDTLLACARAAEAAGIDDVYVVDHIAIPPDDAEGSEGRYLDPLATLAWLAGATQRVGLGTSVLILPYRPALPTAKWVATVQELSGGRLALGVGVGWMRPEFQALGVPRSRRGALTDRALELLHRCFANDEVEEHGQRFLFRPRPPRPPFFIGGSPPHALERAVRLGDGWMPMDTRPERLAPHVRRLHELAAHAGRPAPEVVAMGPLPLADPPRALDQLGELRQLGVTRVVCTTGRYRDADSFRRQVDELTTTLEPALGSRAP